jgi:hypothetical protein
MKSNLHSIEHLYRQLQDVVLSIKIERARRRKQVVSSFFEMLCCVLDLPLYTKDIELRATELIGDFLKKLNDNKNALFYYIHAVMLKMSIRRSMQVLYLIT